MDKSEIAEEIGNKIIQGQHDYFAEGNSEDLMHITNQKRIITSISEYLESKDVPANQIKRTEVELRRTAKDLFINTCLSSKDDEDDEVESRESSEFWFDYIYKNEKYSR